MFETILWPIQFILNIDSQLATLFAEWGLWTYLIVWLIVFCETGLVVTPVLPGDSLLFAAGALASRGNLDIHTLAFGTVIAAIAGDATNYAIGRFAGIKLLRYPRIFKPKYLDQTKRFYERYGAKSIVLCRFAPIVRTFAPFMAGIGQMSYRLFTTFNIVGALLWVGAFVYGGFFFAEVAWIKKNFTAVIIGIIVISLMPAVWQLVNHRFRSRRA